MRNLSAETRQRMSESAKRRCSDPKWLEQQHSRATPLPIDVVRKMYESGMTQKEIGERLGASQKVIWRCMKNNGISARSTAKRNQYGEKNDSWRGGRYIDDAGYVHVKQDGHPRAKTCGGYVMEHILVAERILGRPINRTEVVHHINGIKNDNRPDNLAVMTGSTHRSYHMLVRYGKNPPTPIAVTKLRFPEDDDGADRAD